jgi:hypothetical protein
MAGVEEMSGNISEWDKKIVGWRCGCRCALPECRKSLIIEGVGGDHASVIGEIAHIRGESPGSARYDPNMSDDERNSHLNLMIFCRDHHKMVDDQPQTYTVEKLMAMKRLHEMYISDMTAGGLSDITFIELDVVTKLVVSNTSTQSDSFTVIPPRDKIQKNGLTAQSEKLITMGMSQVRLVGGFINKISEIDMDFGERLKQGFVVAYERLRNEEHKSGDELFDGLFKFASGGNSDFKVRAAGLAVLVYLFEKCEVFER